MNEINLYGTVGDSFWGEEYFTALDVRMALTGLTGPLTVRLNSGGGLATEGQAIYAMLTEYPDDVTVVIDGTAQSAASLIAMAGDKIVMPMGATMMVHDPAQDFTPGRGTEDAHLNLAKHLGVIAGAYSRIYAKQAGISPEDARAIMKEEVTFDGPAAVTAGFATECDELNEAAPAALFDYRVYAKAPKELREVGASIKRPKSRLAVMAMMAGLPAPTEKGTKMAKDTELEGDDTIEAGGDGVLAEGDGEDTMTAAGEDTIEGGDGDAGDGASEGAEDDDASETAVAVQIMDLAEVMGLPMASARDMIGRKLTLAQATAEMTEKKRKENPLSGATMRGQQPARILRDERQTRRIGMTGAIAAQIGRASKVDDVARPFMNMSLCEMAAVCAGYEGSMRTAGDRLSVFMAASHATSDFPAIFENALNKSLLERYQVAEPTYRLISRRKNFNDFRTHPMVRAGDFPKLKPIGEGGEIKFGTFGENKETAILSSYATGLRISRQMMINDELGAIDEVLSDYGQMIVDFEEETFYAFFASAKLANNTAIFHASHNNLASSGGAISVTTVSAGRAAMRKQESIDKQKLNLSPSILLVGPDQETAAEQLVAVVQPDQSANVNPFSGKLTPVVTAQITGNAWHLMAGPDRPGGACFVHGFLDGAEAPRIRTEEPFGQQGMAMTIEHDFGLGAVDYRGAYKNPGQ